MCGSIVDIQSPTAEIRRGIRKKKDEERRKKKETTGQKYNGKVSHFHFCQQRRICKSAIILESSVQFLERHLTPSVAATKFF